MIMPNALLRPHAERQGEVCVRLLSIVIWSNSVHPQNNLIMIFILKQIQLCVSIQKLLYKDGDNAYKNKLCSTETPMKYRSADKSLARTGRKQATATEDFEFQIPYL